MKKSPCSSFSFQYYFPEFYDCLQNEIPFEKEEKKKNMKKKEEEKQEKENLIESSFKDRESINENDLPKSLENMFEESQKTEEDIDLEDQIEKYNQKNIISSIINQTTNLETYNISFLNNKQITQLGQFNNIFSRANSPKSINENFYLSQNMFLFEENNKKYLQTDKEKISSPLFDINNSQQETDSFKLIFSENNTFEEKLEENIKKENIIKIIPFKIKIQKKGRPSEKNNFIGKKIHRPTETLNAVKKIFCSCNYRVHDFFWNYIKYKLKEKNIQINLNKGKKYSLVEIKLTKLDKDKNKVIPLDKINIAPPSITKLITGNTEGEEEEEFDVNNKYHNINGYANKCQEILNENIITLYIEHSLPKRSDEDKKEKFGINQFERSKKRREAYKQKIKYFLYSILKTEDNKENQPINYLFNLKFGNFMKIFMNYDNAQEIENEICQNIYDGEKTKLEGFSVYENCKKEFSSDIKDQENYRNYIFRIIEDKKEKRKRK